MKKGHIDILTILGGKPSNSDDSESDESSTTLALRAAFKAIKDDDFDGFDEAMTEWMSCCDDTESDSDSEKPKEDENSY